MKPGLKTKIAIIILLIFMPKLSCSSSAQTKLAGTVGLSSSANMGEIGPSPIFKSTLTTGDKFKFEDVFEFNPMDKYTGAGWYVKNGVDILIFPSSSSPSFFVIASGDFTHRDGGPWAKDGVRIGAGVGYENTGTQFRFYLKDKIMTWNDNVSYSPYFEFLARGDYPLSDSNWGLRAETKAGFFKYVQNSYHRTAFYLDAGIGFTYKWP